MHEKTQPRLKARISPAGVLIFLGLAAWNLWIYWPPQGAPVTLPYSSFLSEVEAGNVASVTITGSLIEGLLLQPLAAQVEANRTTRRGSLNFRSVFPQGIGDAGLLSRLEAHHVQVEAVPQLAVWLTPEGAGGLPPLLLILCGAWLALQACGSGAGGRTKTLHGAILVEHPQETFADAAGADEAVHALLVVVEYLRRVQSDGDQPGHGGHSLLLAGPAGAGKALLARAAAGEARAGFLRLNAFELAELPDAALASGQLSELFATARAAAPAVVFIENLDALGSQAFADAHDRQQVIYTLLAEIDRLANANEPAVALLAATHRPQGLDPALLRPGRFDRRIGVDLPDVKGREGILRIYTRAMRLAAGVNLGRLARTTTGFCGDDLKALCREAAQAAARKQHAETGMDDFEDALDRILLGSTRAMLLDDHERLASAYHTAGHALTAWLIPGAVPGQKWSILTHGWAPQAEDELPGGEPYSASRETLLARLAVLLGGRAAEQAALGELSTASKDDLAQANRLARRMVACWGMGSLGLLTCPGGQAGGNGSLDGSIFSEETAARIDRDVVRLLAECYQADRRLFASAHPGLDELAQALMQDETIDQDGLARILGARGAIPVEPVAVTQALADRIEF